MWTTSIALALALGSALCLSGPTGSAPLLTSVESAISPVGSCATTSAISPGNEDEVSWVSWSEASQMNSKKSKARPVLVDFYTDWCGWCKRQDATTFRDPRVVAYLNKHFHAIKFDAEGSEPITYHGENLGRSGKTHEWALRLATQRGRIGYPTMVILDETGAPLTVLPGYHSPEKLLPLLTYYGEGYYRDFNFATFEGMYTLPLNR